MKNQQKAEEIASQRVQWLAPLLVEGLDAAQAQQLKAQICAQTGLSERTVRRYVAQYRHHGFEGLKPKSKGRSITEAVAAEWLDQAILLRREVPRRSVSQIIQILEWEGKVPCGQLKRSTLQAHLTRRGYSSRHMQLYAGGGLAARRFQKRHRNQLWQGDIKHGPYLPLGPGGAMKQVYLVVLLDDATRFVVSAFFAPTMDQSVVERSFRQAVTAYGVPEAVYFDNGKQYRTQWMARTCSKLGTQLIYTRPYSPESKGKIERFNRTVDAFFAEVALERPKTLDQLNQRLAIWLSEGYHHQPHASLPDQQSPQATFQSDNKPLRWIQLEQIHDAFLHAETRKVDKSGCISFMDKKYEVGLPFLGHKVTILYDPLDTTTLTVEYEGHPSWQVAELVIGERAGKRPKLPEHEKQPTENSRYLDAAEKQHQQRQEEMQPALRFDAVWREGTDLV